MRATICLGVALILVLTTLGCGEIKNDKGPSEEQQKTTNDEMKKLVDKANKKKK
jgi:hypothetical protein